jgi:hypothetical protein
MKEEFIYLNSISSLSTFGLTGIGLKPIKIFTNLSDHVKFKSELRKKGGVYGFILTSASDIVSLQKSEIEEEDNLTDKMYQYIGSSSDLYSRFLDHLNGRDSNIRLQRSISKYGINKFVFGIYY